MTDDSPIVEEVRQRRALISRQYGDDLQKYGEHLREIEERNADRVVNQITVVKGRGSEGPRHSSAAEDGSFDS
jgi:hypothetical protein